MKLLKLKCCVNGEPRSRLPLRELRCEPLLEPVEDPGAEDTLYGLLIPLEDTDDAWSIFTPVSSSSRQLSRASL